MAYFVLSWFNFFLFIVSGATSAAWHQHQTRQHQHGMIQIGRSLGIQSKRLVNHHRFSLSNNNKNHDGDKNVDQGDPVLRLPLMEAELAALEGNSNNDKDAADSASKLKTSISDAKTAAEFGVRRAQLEFYDAFSSADIDAMDKVWSTESHVRCVHPGMSSLEGRESVMESWKQMFSMGSGGGGRMFSIEPERAQVEVCGLTAICSCVEKTEGGGSLEALNIYKREGSSWRMTLHMAGPVVVRQQIRDASS